MEISFTAKYIKSIPIVSAENNSHKNASIVQLDINSDDDMVLINGVTNLYNKYPNIEGVTNYSKYIRDNFNRLYNNPSQRKYEDFYALTIQDINKNGNTINMDKDKILGMVLVDNNPENEFGEVEYLQVSPATNYHAAKQPYKGVGKALVSTILNIFYPKDVLLFYDKCAKTFYDKQGFECLDHPSSRLDCMIYRQNK